MSLMDLIQQLTGRGQQPQPPAGGDTQGAMGMGGGAPAPAAPPAQPQAYTSPPELMQLYSDLMTKQRKAANIDRGIGLIGASLAYEENRPGILAAFNGGGSGGSGPADQINMMMKFQADQSALQQKAAQRAAVPAIAKQYGLDTETAMYLFDAGKLDSVIAEAEKPSNEIVKNDDGTFYIVDKNTGGIGEAMGVPKKREIELIDSPDGGKIAVYKDDKTRVGSGDLPSVGVTNDDKLWRVDEEDRKARGLPSRSLSEFIDSTGRAKAGSANLGPSGIDFGDPPKDMAWVRDAQGNIKTDEKGAPMAQPISGGPAQLEADAAAKSAAEKEGSAAIAADVVTDDIDRVIKIIDDNKDSTLTKATGLTAAIGQFLPGHPAYNATKLADTVRANVGFDRLQAMRDNSPTGAALGPVSDFENKLLQATAGNLELTQDREQVLFNLRRVQKLYKYLGTQGKIANREEAAKVMKQIEAEIKAGEQEAPLDDLLKKYGG